MIYKDSLENFKKDLEEYGTIYLKEIENQTEEMCLLTVMHCGRMIEFVKNQTPIICLAAVNQNGLALKYVKEQNKEICIAAVLQNKNALQFVNPTFINEAREVLKGQEPAIVRAKTHLGEETIVGLLLKEHQPSGDSWVIAQIKDDSVDLTNALGFKFDTLEFIERDSQFFYRNLIDDYRYSFPSYDTAMKLINSDIKCRARIR